MLEGALKREVFLVAPFRDTVHPECRDYILIKRVFCLENTVDSLQSSLHVLLAVLSFLTWNALEFGGLVAFIESHPDTFTFTFLILHINLNIIEVKN